MAEGSLHLDVSAGGQATDARGEARRRQRPQRIEVGDARSGQPLTLAQAHLLRDAADGRRHLRHEHASRVLERGPPPHEQDRPSSRGLRKRHPPDLVLPRGDRRPDGAHATRAPGQRRLRAFDVRCDQLVALGDTTIRIPCRAVERPVNRGANGEPDELGPLAFARRRDALEIARCDRRSRRAPVSHHSLCARGRAPAILRRTTGARPRRAPRRHGSPGAGRDSVGAGLGSTTT